jgi:hypothetical protein
VSDKPLWVQVEPALEDFAEKNYIIIQHSPMEEPFGYSQDSLMGAHVANRMAEVQEKFGCTLEFTQVPYDNQFASALQGLTYAENGGDIVFSNNNAQLRKTLGTGGEESLMQDMLAFDHILNFWNTDKWGSIYARECMMAGGTFYGLVPALWVDCTPLPYYQVVYNKDILETFGATDPQEYWEREEWDRDAMIDVITSCYDDSGANTVWGMTASMTHMVCYTFLTTGLPFAEVDAILPDGSAEWHRGLDTADAQEALQWLKNTLSIHRKYFNNGQENWKTWDSQTPFIDEQCAMAVTRPSTLFGEIVTAVDNFGLITWGGADANTLCGFYENTYAVSIPVFAQSAYQSAFLIWDLFEGLDGIETYEDVIRYYRETYFSSDLDVEVLVREGVALDYSYWPNGVSSFWDPIVNGFTSASSVKALVEKNMHVSDTEFETHVIPNKVKLEQYRQNGFFN